MVLFGDAYGCLWRQEASSLQQSSEYAGLKEFRPTRDHRRGIGGRRIPARRLLSVRGQRGGDSGRQGARGQGSDRE